MNFKKYLLFSIIFFISICSVNARSIALTYSDTLERIKTCTNKSCGGWVIDKTGKSFFN